MKLNGLFLALALGALTLSCGSDDDDEKGTGGTSSGGTGGSTGGKGGSGGSTGGSGGSTGGSAGSSSGGSAGTAAGGTGGSTTCGDFGQVEQCQTCLKEKCCTEGKNCAASPDCQGMVDCARLCPEPTNTSSECVQTCGQQHNLGGGNYNGLIICMSNNCGTVCGYL